ncbi:MAG: CAP domain-containing protein [Planctomycetes bacterium]|nr:CAP domain-containing protein [Planctomycetota bacterium]
MAPCRIRAVLCTAVTLLLLFTVAIPTALAQDDDDFIKELRKKKEREKAIAEGRDPDAEPEKAPPAKPKLPPTASGWVSTIQRKWDSDKETDQQLVREAIDKLKEAIDTEAELKKDVIEDFQGFKEGEAEKYIADAIRKSGVSVDSLRAVLDEHRPNALKAIMNPSYTEADDCRLQPEVDKACEPLFKVWRDPVAYAVEKHDLNLATPGAKLEGLASLLGELSDELANWPDDCADAASLMRARGAALLNVKEKEYKSNAGVLEANEKVEGATLTDEDKSHVRVLNDYRMMLGKGALTINATLSKACFEHSKYMNQIKQLAHNINGHPYGRTPQDRARRAGFGGSVAENCLVGAETGDQAVWQWYNAAEHHRNMIGNHSIIGIGHDGSYWTQNFSGGGRGR